MIFVTVSIALTLASGALADAPAAALRACLGTDRYAANVSALDDARRELAPEVWSDSCRQAREAYERSVSVRSAILLTGESPVGGYPSTLRQVQRARAASDPLLVELFSRTARDQSARESLSHVAKNHYARGLAPTALQLLNALVSSDAIQTDADNRAWLRRVVDERGWFTVSRDGAEADSAAWLIVQHGDADRDFQRSMLTLLEPLAVKGETSYSRFAHLFDRWAAGADQPQRFGIMGECKGPGVWEARVLEDPVRVNERRAAAGLSGTLADHQQAMSSRCS